MNLRDSCTFIPIQLWYLHLGLTECVWIGSWTQHSLWLPSNLKYAAIPRLDQQSTTVYSHFFLAYSSMVWAAGSKHRWRRASNVFLKIDVLGVESVFSGKMPWVLSSYVFLGGSCYWVRGIPCGLMPLNMEVLAVMFWQKLSAWKEKQELVIYQAGGKWGRKNSSASKYMKNS